MADGVVLNPGVGGSTAATDDIAGQMYQRIKLIHGADGINAGDVALANPLPTRSTGATSACTNVGASAVTGTVLASNAARLRAWLYNDADKNVFVKFGAVATAASFTKKLLPYEFFSVDGYTGIIDAIWEAGPTGNMRVTELTA